MLISCKCLNVSIRDENGCVVKLDIEKLGLSSIEQRDPFFRERLVSASGWRVSCAEVGLVQRHTVGPWLIHRCLVCSSYTHASLASGTPPSQDLLVNESLLTTEEAVEAMRQSEQYSTVFGMLVHEGAVEAEGDGRRGAGSGLLGQRLTQALQMRMEAVEEAVRVYCERQYADFEEFRDRAYRDQKILSSYLYQADAGESILGNSKKSTLIPSPNEMPVTPQVPLVAATRKQPVRTNPVSVNKPKHMAAKNTVNLGSYKEDSLDSEGIFDLEGMDSSMPPHNGHNSDTYDSDTDDSVSRDEGIHIARDAPPWGSSIAKSLPVNVPAFTHFHDLSQDGLDQHGEEPQDIAASIKALARSVHGDVFGELPRPRFSTQI